MGERIMRDGFTDSDPEEVRGTEWQGVWFSDIALAEDEGLDPDEFVTVAVEAPDQDLGAYEVEGNPKWGCVQITVFSGQFRPMFAR